jgi:hypothetical protein
MDNNPTFTLTEDHIKLVRRMYVDFDDGGYDGAPAVNLKRPYGNSDVIGDVHEILYDQPFPEDENDDERNEELVSKLIAIHQQTATALQIVLCTGSFVPGVYVRSCKYGALSWKLKK